MTITTKVYRSLQELDPRVRDVFLLVLEEIEKNQRERVTKDEFLELKAVVAELASNVANLAQAQTRTEERLSRVEKAIEELAQAQKKTEERLEELAKAQAKAEERLSRVEKAIEELAQAQKKTEERLEELAQAQKKTEERLEELAQAQKKTEERLEELAKAQSRAEERLSRVEKAIEELAQAQKKTEERLEKLIEEHKKTREHLGGLTHTVGYRLEDEAIWALPALLKRDFGIEVIGQLKRDFIEISSSKYVEVNIWGEGVRNSKTVFILGEAKTQLKKNHVNDFLNRVEKLKQLIKGNIFPVLVTYHTSPPVKNFAKEQGIALYFSYELRQ